MIEPSEEYQRLQARVRELESAVAEGKRADEELQKSEEQYRRLVELSPDAIGIQSENRIVFMNSAGVSLFGAENAGQLIGKSVWDFVLPEYREIVEERYRQMREKGTKVPLIELKLTRLDGTNVDVEVTAIPFIYDDKPAIQAVFRDVTERKRVEEALAAAHAFQQSIIDGVAEEIMVIGADYRVRLMNRAAREFSSGGAGVSESLLCYQISHRRETPCDGTECPCPLEWVRESGQPVTLVHEHYHANGERRLVEIVASPLWGADGAFQGIIESMRDITERKQAEEALQQHTERLRALTAQMAEVAEDERQRLARELHDQVGQNLTALGINLNIVRTQLPAEAAALVRSRLDDSLSLVEQTAERIRDVMANLRPPVLDDYGLVAALHWYAEQFARRTDISVAVEGEDAVPRLAAHVENALFRIAQEALTNVAKHAQATQVTVTVEVDGGSLRLIVADDGLGFDPSTTLRASPAHLADPDRGRGWGLLNMTERAEAVGGRCRIESDPRRGTQVVVEVNR